jgi:HNH endonuclease
MRIQIDGRRRLMHVLLAEKALGRSLPAKAHVHHVNGNPGDNTTPWNLVVCPDAAYHKLLHMRGDALAACGHADWRRCKFCKAYDSLANLRRLAPLNGKERPYWEHIDCSKRWWNDYYRRRQAKKART